MVPVDRMMRPVTKGASTEATMRHQETLAPEPVGQDAGGYLHLGIGQEED